MSAGRIVLLIFGILLIIVSFGLLAAGGVVLAVDNSFKDSQGYYTSGTLPVNAPSPAVVTEPLDIHVDGAWFVRNPDALTIRVISTNSSKPVFLGVARTSDLDSYLSGTSYDEVNGFNYNSSVLKYVHHLGKSTLAPPTDQSFWVASVTGSGTQTLQWNIASGNYSLILMNADGSSTIDTDITIGVKIPQIVHTIGLGLLIGGIVLIVGGGVMTFFGIRGW